MLLSRRGFSIGSLAVGLAAGLIGAVMITSGSGPAEAQSRASNGAVTTVSYTSGLVGEVIPSTTDAKVEEVYPFPGAPVFLFRTKKGLTAWERTDNGIRKVLDIKLTADFEKIVFLEDNRTFVVHTKTSAIVYSVDRHVTISQR